jgi:hypothetical protein
MSEKDTKFKVGDRMTHLGEKGTFRGQHQGYFLMERDDGKTGGGPGGEWLCKPGNCKPLDKKQLLKEMIFVRDTEKEPEPQKSEPQKPAEQSDSGFTRRDLDGPHPADNDVKDLCPSCLRVVSRAHMPVHLESQQCQTDRIRNMHPNENEMPRFFCPGCNWDGELSQMVYGERCPECDTVVEDDYPARRR